MPTPSISYNAIFPERFIVLVYMLKYGLKAGHYAKPDILARVYAKCRRNLPATSSGYLHTVTRAFSLAPLHRPPHIFVFSESSAIRASGCASEKCATGHQHRYRPSNARDTAKEPYAFYVHYANKAKLIFRHHSHADGIDIIIVNIAITTQSCYTLHIIIFIFCHYFAVQYCQPIIIHAITI